MRLKIVHQNPEKSGETLQGIRTEGMEMEQIEDVQTAASTGDEFLKEESPLRRASPVSFYDPVLISGKRKIKPKETRDDVDSVIRKKQSSAKEHKPGKHDLGVTLMSKEEATLGDLTRPILQKSPTMIRAEEVQMSLGDKQPSFLKPLVRSHVGSCFWMGFPVLFCKLHLPTKDTQVILENELGEEFSIKYIAHKTGLSAGWRKFVSGNTLIEGDVLVFHLIEPCRFKVYIIRANDLNEVDGALSLLTLDSQAKQDGGMDASYKIQKRPKSLPFRLVQKKKQKNGVSKRKVTEEQQSTNDSDEVASEIVECSKLSESTSQFQDSKAFEDFQIVINGTCLDSEIPDHIRRKYHDLCCCRNTHLHDRLLPGLYSKLAASIIVEAVNITDAIRGCKLTTPRKDFDIWEKSLRSFELLGLNVGFVRARLKRLMSMAFDSEGAADSRRYWDAQTSRIRTEDEILSLEAKLVEFKVLSAKYGGDMEKLRMDVERFEVMFQEEVNAPW